MNSGLLISAVLLMVGTSIVFLAQPSLADAPDRPQDDGSIPVWTIWNDTTISDTTVRFNGSVHVMDGVLRLQNATVVVGNQSQWYIDLTMDDGTGLVLVDSVLAFEGAFTIGELSCDVTSIGSTVQGNGYLSMRRGDVVMRDSTVSGIDLVVLDQATILDTDFLDGAALVAGHDYGDTHAPVNVTVERCLFRDRPHYGVCVIGPWHQGFNSTVVVRDCTFVNRSRPMQVAGFLSGGSAILEGNVVVDCYQGLSVFECGPALTFRENFIDADYGMSLESCARLDIDNVTINASFTGVVITGSNGDLTMSNMDIYGMLDAVQASGVRLCINDSVVGSLVNHFTVESSTVDLFDTLHGTTVRIMDLRSQVRSWKGVRVRSVAWRDGPTIPDGAVTFLDAEGDQVGSMDIGDPGRVPILRWQATASSASWTWDVLPWTSKDGQDWASDAFDLSCTDVLDLRFRDTWTPVVVIDTPEAGILQASRTIQVEGTVDERGSGLAGVRVRVDGGERQDVDILEDGTFRLTLDVADGVHSLQVSAEDLTGLTGLDEVADVEVDTTPPFIEVLSPGPTTNERPVHLRVRTEVGSTAHMDLGPVPVDAEGLIEVDLDLDEGVVSVTLVVVDPAGNRNSTSFPIEVDFTPPLISVSEPTHGGWVPTGTLTVRGVSEEDAIVLVDGLGALRNGAEFTQTFDVDEGPVTVLIEATDTAGNTGTLLVEATVDVTPPVLLVEDPWDGMSTAEPELLAQGLLADLGPVELDVNGVPASIEGDRWACGVTLSEGRNEVRVKAVDGAGHVTMEIMSVFLDTTPPSMELALVVGEVEHRPVPAALSVPATAALLRIHLDEPCELVARGLGRFEVVEGWTMLELELEELALNEFSVDAIDRAGNSAGEVAFAVTVDLQPPDLEILEPVEGTAVELDQVVIRGITEQGAYLTIGGFVVGVSSDGTFAHTVQLVEGENTFEVVASDDLGNERSLVLRILYRPTPESVDVADRGHDPWFLVVLVLAVVPLAVLRYRRRPL